jgi:ubiquinone/menaquinone biosynthesis C-methylase UbiE
VRVPELMDDPAIDPRELRQALDALNRTNRALGADRRLFAAVRGIAPGDAPSVLDLGAGGGGFLRYVHARTPERNGTPLIALDFSPNATARENGDLLNFLVGDARRVPLASASVDVVTCSLFLHHFDPPDVIRILREAARVARRGVVVSDLTRSSLSWLVTWTMTRVLSRSRLFHVDGPRSVRAAYTPGELLELAQSAGMAGARVRRSFPFRMILHWSKERSVA